MSVNKKITSSFKSAKVIPYDSASKFIIMSDCHRGDGGWSDNFSNNQNLFFAALNYYYTNHFTYIELGDGDELWENRKPEQVISMHSDAFWLMSKFYQKGNFHMLYGNHDMVKKSPKFTEVKYSYYYDESEKKRLPLFPKITVHESLILKNVKNDCSIFLTHGHQADFLNYDLWRLARFLVRYVWRPLELLGIHDPTNAAKNHVKKIAIEKRLVKWSKDNNQMLIAGHTHRPVFPKVGEPLYFNDGSCVHPRCITAIEIEKESISLVKWTLKTRRNRTLYVGRVILEGPVKIEDFYNDLRLTDD